MPGHWTDVTDPDDFRIDQSWSRRFGIDCFGMIDTVDGTYTAELYDGSAWPFWRYDTDNLADAIARADETIAYLYPPYAPDPTDPGPPFF